MNDPIPTRDRRWCDGVLVPSGMAVCIGALLVMLSLAWHPLRAVGSVLVLAGTVASLVSGGCVIVTDLRYRRALDAWFARRQGER